MTETHASHLPSEAMSCRANFSAAGRRRRRRVAMVLGLVSIGVCVGLVASDASAWTRMVVALPAASAAVVGLQVRRNTCLAHAAAGTFEHDDFSTTKVEAAFAEASRRVARTIYRDGIAIGVVAGVLGFASAWMLP
jgi:hypothetical protein